MTAVINTMFKYSLSDLAQNIFHLDRVGKVSGPEVFTEPTQHSETVNKKIKDTDRYTYR